LQTDPRYRLRRTLFFGGGVALCFLGMVSTSMALAGEEGSVVASSSVCSRSWENPKLVSVERPGLVARFPRLAIGPKRSYVVGIDIQQFDDHVIENGPLVVEDLDGKVLGKPQGKFAFLFPRATVVDGSLRLVWAEPTAVADHIEARRWFFQRPVATWSSTYDSKSGWSVPERLSGPTQLEWTFRGGADNFGSTEPLQGIILNGRGLADWYDARLTRHTLTMPRGAIYPSIAFDGNQGYLAYIAAISAQTVAPDARLQTSEDRSSIFIRTSGDSGKTWGKDRIVSVSGTNPAFEVNVLVGTNHDVHLVWKQALAAGGSSIRHILSTDGGLTWDSANDVAPGADFTGLRAAVDSCGVVHVVYQDWSGGPGQLRVGYVTWRGGWSRPVRPFADYFGATPDLRVDATRAPILIFVGRKVDQAGETVATYVSRLAPNSP
jgi:hypothetical protein